MEKLRKFLEFTLFEVSDYKISIYNILLLLAVFLGVKIAFWIAQKTIKRKIKSRGLDDGRFESIFLLVKYVVYVLAVFFSFKSMGIDVSLILGASAALLVGIGLGLQQLFYDIASGVLILIEGSIEIGDIVQVNELVGRVKTIRLRTTVLETLFNTNIIVPNSKFVSDNVINWNHIEETTIFKVSVGVAYGSDVDKVCTQLKNAAIEHEKVLKTPEPFIKFSNFGESSLDFDLIFWTKEIWYAEMIKSDLRFSIERKFREHNITIPFPQRDVHVYNKIVT